MSELKLYLLLLGSKAPGRNVEQHDYFFGIASALKDLVSEIRAFWPEAGASIHIDGWREVNRVDDYQVTVVSKGSATVQSLGKLFFVNLGGYKAGKLEEQHYVMLTVQDDRAAAIREAKKTIFFKASTVSSVKGANAHIDEEYGIDVDDIYHIEDLLTNSQKEKYQIQLTAYEGCSDDDIHLGYLKLNKLS
ncbi:hypothetical protein BH09BAC6_BH09BAC6_31170 [soil metagenome]|jgi:hypothetical protein